MKDIKSFIKLILGGTILFLGTALACVNVIGLIPLYIGCQITVDGISGNFVKNSCFIINRKKKIKLKDRKFKVDMIEQNALNLVKMAQLVLKKDKQENFINETYNIFEQLPQTRNGEIIKYGCSSHAVTYGLLKVLQRNGYIQNLEKHEKDRTSRLILEELAMGKIPSFKKRKMYNMCFELTDKKIDREALNNLLSGKTQTESTTSQVQQVIESVKTQTEIKQNEIQKENNEKRVDKELEFYKSYLQSSVQEQNEESIGTKSR